MFGSSSEKTLKNEIPGQLSLFNEAEICADASVSEPITRKAEGAAITAAENAIHPFTIGRKNWLFADTPKGAKASAAVYSLIETAKANGLNVYTYLQFLLMYMPDSDWRNYPEELDDLMPWSPAVQEECKQ